MTNLRKCIICLRVVGLATSAAGAFLYIGIFRTAEFGLSLRMLVLSLLVLLPFLCIAAVSLIGLGWRRILAGAAIWALATLLAVEGLAQAQEAVFKSRYRDLPPSADALYEVRWWPFTGNVLRYVPARDEWSADC